MWEASLCLLLVGVLSMLPEQPHAPTGLAASTTVTLAWEPPPDGGEPIVAYAISGGLAGGPVRPIYDPLLAGDSGDPFRRELILHRIQLCMVFTFRNLHLRGCLLELLHLPNNTFGYGELLDLEMLGGPKITSAKALCLAALCRAAHKTFLWESNLADLIDIAKEHAPIKKWANFQLIPCGWDLNAFAASLYLHASPHESIGATLREAINRVNRQLQKCLKYITCL